MNKKEYHRKYMKKYREDNKEKLKEDYLNNKDNIKKRDKKYYLKNKNNIKERMNQYYLENKETILERTKKYSNIPEIKERIKKYRREYRILNINDIRSEKKEYRLNNKDNIKEKANEYYLENKEKIKNNTAQYQKEREKKDKEFAIRCRLRGRLRIALNYYLKHNKHSISKKELVDYKSIIESLKPFPKNISFYHIDHIRPLCSFDLTKKQQIKEAFSPKNHQWLLAKENLSKGGRYE